jgi:A/G-specific adenine glycosylase
VMSSLELAHNNHFVMLQSNSSILGEVGQVCNKGQDSMKLKLVDESSIDSMGLTSGIRKVIAVQMS